MPAQHPARSRLVRLLIVAAVAASMAAMAIINVVAWNQLLGPQLGANPLDTPLDMALFVAALWLVGRPVGWLAIVVALLMALAGIDRVAWLDMLLGPTQLFGYGLMLAVFGGPVRMVAVIRRLRALRAAKVARQRQATDSPQ
jgi:hypothetical protein